MQTLAQLIRSTAVVAALAALSACANMSEHDKNVAIGAGVGAVAGSALTGGNAAGTVGGAVVGGVIGDRVKRK